MPVKLDVAQLAKQPGRPVEVRFQARRLHGALDDMAATLSERFLVIERESAEQVFERYLRTIRQERKTRRHRMGEKTLLHSKEHLFVDVITERGHFQ